MADATTVLESVKGLAGTFAAARRERQLRRELDPRDFIALRDAGFLLTGVPADRGGLWVDVPHSTRPIAAILRALARGVGWLPDGVWTDANGYFSVQAFTYAEEPPRPRPAP